MSLFDAFVRDFFGSDPFFMRPQPAPQPQNPIKVHRVTHMVEGVVNNGNSRTFRTISYSSGSKSMNNISNLEQRPSAKKQPLALTYNSAPKPVNPDRIRCSSVCEGWKKTLRSDKPERLLPAIPNNRPDPKKDQKLRRGSERFSRHTTRSTLASRKRSEDSLNRSYPGAGNRRKLMSRNTDTEDINDEAASSSSEDVSNISGGPYRAEDIEEQKLVNVLEREMLSKNPNVPWSEIAGLHEAKGLLQEAVILPILMPDYFQGIKKGFL